MRPTPGCFLFQHHHNVFSVGWSACARTFPLLCTRTSCVKTVNRPDSSPRTLPSPCPSLATGSPPATPPSQQPARQLRCTHEQELLSASQNDRVTLSHHRGCVNVWFGMRDRAVEDTGSGPDTVVLRKVVLRSKRAPHKPRQSSK